MGVQAPYMRKEGLGGIGDEPISRGEFPRGYIKGIAFPSPYERPDASLGA